MSYIGSDPIPPFKGGTGVKNANTSTLTLGGPLTLSGAFPGIFNLTGSTNVTFPTSGTLATTSQVGIGTINGDSGSITGSTVTISSGNASQISGASVLFTGSGSTLSLTLTDSSFNTYLGQGSGGSTSSGNTNTSVGYNSLHAITSGSSVNAFGYQSALRLTSGSNSVFYGPASGFHLTTGSFNCILGDATSLDTSSSFNTLIGMSVLGSNTAVRNYNIAIGYESGLNYSGTESSTILLGSQGNPGQSNAIYIGNQGSGNNQQNSCYIAGINNTDSSGFTSPLAVFVDSITGQLGFGSGGSGGISTLTGNGAGGATGSSVDVTTGASNTNGTCTFSASGAAVTFNTADGNSNVSYGPSSLPSGGGTGGANFCFGSANLPILSTGGNNVFCGSGGNNIATGSYNIGVGGNTINGTDGSYNVGIGWGALGNVSGANANRNTIVSGFAGGYNYLTTESDNIIFGYNNRGTTGESNTLRIGNGTGTGGGNLQAAFISGIAGVTVASTAAVLVNTGTDQLGTIISSARFKENIQDMGNASDVIYKLRPVKFTLKQHPEYGTQTGLIAEEVFDVAPQLVCLDREGLPSSVSYHELPALLLNELQKLQKRVEELEAKQK